MHFSSIRFSFANLLMLLNAILLLRGGITLWVGATLILLLLTVIDEIFGDIDEQEVAAPPAFLDAMVFLTLPLIALNSALYAGYFASETHTALGGLLARAGIDYDGARAGTGAFDLAGATLTIGVLYGWAMNVCHELSHRTTDPIAGLNARWLGAFSLESAFPLQHLTGHHMNSGFFDDPGTSRRGESVYAFVLRASIGNNLFAFRSEAARLARRGLPVWSPQNRFLRGQLMSVALGLGFYALGGLAGVGALLVAGLLGRHFLESAAYVEHYGLVRVPGTRFEARHAWNSYRSLSNGMLYNVERHAHHHLFAGKPYYKLLPDAGAPQLPFGYMTMFAFSLLPPLFDRVMRKSLADWDLNYATEAERQYIVANGKELRVPAPAE